MVILDGILQLATMTKAFAHAYAVVASLRVFTMIEDETDQRLSSIMMF